MGAMKDLLIDRMNEEGPEEYPDYRAIDSEEEERLTLEKRQEEAEQADRGDNEDHE